MNIDKKDYFYVKTFYCNNDYYYLCVTKMYGVILAKATPIYDPFLKHWDDAEPTTAKIESKNKFLGMLVYKKTIKYFIEYLYKFKPYYFYYTTGGDSSRTKLYMLFCKLAERHGYTCYFQDGFSFNFLRK